VAWSLSCPKGRIEDGKPQDPFVLPYYLPSILPRGLDFAPAPRKWFNIFSFKKLLKISIPTNTAMYHGYDCSVLPRIREIQTAYPWNASCWSLLPLLRTYHLYVPWIYRFVCTQYPFFINRTGEKGEEFVCESVCVFVSPDECTLWLVHGRLPAKGSTSPGATTDLARRLDQKTAPKN
jgi:hypothetical protein